MLHVFLRTAAMYLLLVAGIRFLGKRQVGQMAPSEFVLTMLAANLATMAIEDPEATPLPGVVAILTILSAELTLSLLTMRFLPMRRLLCGKPVILIENGHLLQQNLRRTRVTLEELSAMLRENQILDPGKVRYAILETGGTLSVFPYAGERPATAREAGICPEEEALPVSLVEDGHLLKENLARAGRSPAWVRTVVRDRGAEIRDTMLLSVDDRGTVEFIRREL